MYNSRPRRTNYDGYSKGFAVPENYSGNAFRESGTERVYEEKSISVPDTDADEVKEVVEVKDTAAAEGVSEPVAKIFEKEQKRKGSGLFGSGFGFNVGNIFKGGIGFEELLIIGLIFLIAQSDNNDDIIVLLALLLFIN